MSNSENKGSPKVPSASNSNSSLATSTSSNVSSSSPGTSNMNGHCNGDGKKRKNRKKKLIQRHKKKLTEANSFEGPEKVLEIGFKPTPQLKEMLGNLDKSGGRSGSGGSRNMGLRSVSQTEWSVMLALVRCQVLSVLSNDYLDAYLLSESSLFVYPCRVVLKTCGRTLLLNAVHKLLAIASDIGLTEVENVFYTRKKFLFPHKQIWPHTSFKHETDFLDKVFHGSAYVLGKVNGDHWYIYMNDDPLSDSVKLKQKPDVTLEILMTGLDPSRANLFMLDSHRQKNSSSNSAASSSPSPSTSTPGTDNEAKTADLKALARRVTASSGIGALFPGALLDDFLFQPMGYSINGLVDDGYFTIHITPQAQCSYASFETNLGSHDYSALIERVLEVFRPSRFTLLFFANESAQQWDQGRFCSTFHRAFHSLDLCQRSEDIRVVFQNYTLNYCLYDRLTNLQTSPISRTSFFVPCSSSCSAPSLAPVVRDPKETVLPPPTFCPSTTSMTPDNNTTTQPSSSSSSSSSASSSSSSSASSASSVPEPKTELSKPKAKGKTKKKATASQNPVQT